MVRLLLISAALHVGLGVALWRLRVPPPEAPAVVEIELRREREPEPVREPVREPDPVREPEPARTKRTRVASSARIPPTAPRGSSSDPVPAPVPAPAPVPGPDPAPAPDPVPPPSRRPNLFAGAALERAAGIDVAASVDRGYRPRRGVGGVNGAGGTDVASFLAEDAARMRVDKGAVAPELRRLERRLHESFSPTFNQADNSNRAELFIKQFRGFLKNPPKTGELARAIDPTKETLAEKIRSTRPEQAFFLGRRVEIFVRQAPDGHILEMAIRQGSGYRAYDDAALAAVEKALDNHLPAGADNSREVRTLWQLDATAYVVISPEPQLVFDESSGKSEWLYPLKKKVDHAVKLVAVY